MIKGIQFLFIHVSIVFGEGQIPINRPIGPFSLKARDFNLEAADMMWILGVVARLTKFASLKYGAEGGGGGVEATKALKASSKMLRRSS